MKKILITGGAGFIGSNLCEQLYNKGYEVVVLDSLSPQIHGENYEESHTYGKIKNISAFFHGDVRDRELLQKLVTGVDAIVHLAAETGTGQSMYEIERYTDVNVNGTAILLDILANEKHSVKKLVVASSRSIYGEGKYMSKEFGAVYPATRKDSDMKNGDFEVKYEGSESLELVATDEDSKIQPLSVYAITKYNQEQMVLTVCAALNIKAAALRYQNVYGPGQSLSNPYTGILSIFSTQIKNNSPINIFEDGKESRDFVYIDDVVNATILALENDAANNQVFNVGSGVATSVLTVAETLLEFYGAADSIPVRITGNYRVGDIRHNFADIKKISSMLGFYPRYSFREGIKEFTDWVATQEVNEDKYELSISELKQKGLYK